MDHPKIDNQNTVSPLRATGWTSTTKKKNYDRTKKREGKSQPAQPNHSTRLTFLIDSPPHACLLVHTGARAKTCNANRRHHRAGQIERPNLPPKWSVGILDWVQLTVSVHSHSPLAGLRCPPRPSPIRSTRKKIKSKTERVSVIHHRKKKGGGGRNSTAVDWPNKVKSEALEREKEGGKSALLRAKQSATEWTE